MDRPRLVIAFGSGGARALGSLGVMTVLRKHGIKPDAVCGSSMGAVIAAYYGVHGETESLRAWYESKSAMQYLSYMSVAKLSCGIIGTKRLQPLISEFIKDKRFSQLKVPVRVIATNLHTAESRVFSSGKLLPAIMASIAIPGVMPPYRIGKEWYVDGGVTNPTPFDVFPDAEHILGIDFHLSPFNPKTEPGLLENVMRSAQIAQHASFSHRLEHWNGRVTICTPEQRWTDQALRYDHAAEYIKRGEAAGHELIRLWTKTGMLAKLQVKK
jgi:predicted acylesterase/phospholipase RssA